MEKITLTKPELIVFISCIKPKSIREVNKIWGYGKTNLYPVVAGLKERKLITVEDIEKIGKDKIIKTDFDKFWEYMRNVNETQEKGKVLFELVDENIVFNKTAWNTTKIKISKNEKNRQDYECVNIFGLIPSIFNKDPRTLQRHFPIFPKLLGLLLLTIGRVRLEKNISGMLTLFFQIRRWADNYDALLLENWSLKLTEQLKEQIKISKKQFDTIKKRFGESADEDVKERLNSRKK